MNVVHFCASIEQSKDGVARVLEEIHRFHCAKNNASLYVTAVSGGRNDVRFIEVPSVGIPHYDGYKISLVLPEFIQRMLEKSEFIPDLIHLHSPCTLGLAGLSLARRRSIPVVSTYHTHFPMYLKHHGFSWLAPLAQKYLRYFYNRCDAVLVPSETLCKELSASGIRNVRLVPHGVDTSAFHPKFASVNRRVQLGGEQKMKKMILLFVGRLVWEKNLRLLVQVMRPLLETRTDIAFAIVGTGPAEGELRKMLPQADFLGFRTGVELSEIYASSDIFVFPSDTETFGNVTLEALASGLPCVVADAGGSADLIQNGVNGFRASAQNANDFSTAITTLLNDSVTRQSIAEQAFLSAQQSTWDSVMENMLSVYMSVLEQNQKPHREGNAAVSGNRDISFGTCRFLLSRL